MILGIGNDLLDMRRVEKTLERHGQRFIRRCFTPVESAAAERRRASGDHIATYAKRFAAKEACAKALGSGIAAGVWLKDIGVTGEESGKPVLELTGGALARLQSLTPPGRAARLHLTLTDEPPLVQAFVIIEAA